MLNPMTYGKKMQISNAQLLYLHEQKTEKATVKKNTSKIRNKIYYTLTYFRAVKYKVRMYQKG